MNSASIPTHPIKSNQLMRGDLVKAGSAFLLVENVEIRATGVYVTFEGIAQARKAPTNVTIAERG